MEERIYRNIWKEIGISDAQVEERLSQLISTFFYDEKERLYFPGNLTIINLLFARVTAT